jgi:hypothetical protein
MKMMTINKIGAALLAIGFSTVSLIAKENIPNPNGTGGMTTSPVRNIASDCAPASAQTDLAINNVRARILGGSDMWWDLQNGRYEVPKGSNRHSLFAGALWIGGEDDGGQLKVAAMTYRQDGSDFWPGPLDYQTASTESAICAAFDKHFQVTRLEVEEYVAFLAGEAEPNYQVPNIIYDWPGNRPDGLNEPLAPFYDANGDGFYDPFAGDYPGFDVKGDKDCKTDDMLFGDVVLWWVFNDKGNIHTETGAEPIGLEIHAQAFAFSTNDEINNMTFYQYKIINRSSFQLNNTYFGQWVDPDLGQYQDDYVGCDVPRGLGYCYNGDNEDEGAAGYGLNPPSIGVDFFQGPLADVGDGIDNDRDGIIDEPGEQIIMSAFVYYNNDFTVIGNPEVASHYYQYLKGIWKDGTPIVRNGSNGHQPTGGAGPLTSFMFPGDTDPAFPDSWTEQSAGNTPADRRFLQSAGKFTLLPGAVNYITTGVIWMRTTSGGPFASVELVRLADDKAQALFDNCFQVLNGPDAPDLTIQELDQELILAVSNGTTSNNFQEQYEELDPLIIGFTDTTYKFEGYQIFQLKYATVSITDIYNPDLARLVAQCDIENGVARLINFEVDQSLGAAVPQDMTIEANDKGINHSFSITEDQFATGNRRLVNHKEYFFTVVAYAYNNYKLYNPTDPNGLDGQTKPYKAGRRNIRNYSAIPHIPKPEAGGTVQQAEYGAGPEIIRLDGTGNAGLGLEITQETEDEIVQNYKLENPVYRNGAGPVNVKVYDPLRVPDDQFEMRFSGSTDASTWTLVRLSTNDTVNAERSISVRNEQLIPEWGLSVQVQKQRNPGEQAAPNGLIGYSIEFENDTRRWLTGIADADGESSFNWIRSGQNSGGNYPDFVGLDDEEVYEDVLGGTWAPYRLCASAVVSATTPQGSGPAWNQFQSLSNMANTPSVYVVFTSDKSKWTRVPVVEAGDETVLTEGNVAKFDLRAGQSVNKDGQPDGTGTGWGWFPGYAIDLEKGIRLNMMFAEDSWLTGENGRDMLFNPTSTRTTTLGQIRFGGKHFLYVMTSEYKGDNEQNNPYYALLGNPTAVNKRNVYRDCSWVTIPMVATGEEFLSNDVKVTLQVTKAYANTTPVTTNNGSPHYIFDTKTIATVTDNLTAAESALDLIRVVPNPYYAYSAYETNQLDNRVKITNLPERCIVSIYTVNGTLIRRFSKDSPQTYLEWDLNNQFNIPISSGLYVIHVNAPGVGEKFVKWFGAMRPIDLDTF